MPKLRSGIATCSASARDAFRSDLLRRPRRHRPVAAVRRCAANRPARRCRRRCRLDDGERELRSAPSRRLPRVEPRVELAPRALCRRPGRSASRAGRHRRCRGDARRTSDAEMRRRPCSSLMTSTSSATWTKRPFMVPSGVVTATRSSERRRDPRPEKAAESEAVDCANAGRGGGDAGGDNDGGGGAT